MQSQLSHVGVEITVPTALQNIAIYDYWENAKWAVEIGVGGTRIQVMSLNHGWLWFIPLGPTRTSLGFVCPAEHYKSLNTTPERLKEAVQAVGDRAEKVREYLSQDKPSR